MCVYVCEITHVFKTEGISKVGLTTGITNQNIADSIGKGMEMHTTKIPEGLKPCKDITFIKSGTAILSEQSPAVLMRGVTKSMNIVKG